MKITRKLIALLGASALLLALPACDDGPNNSNNNGSDNNNSDNNNTAGGGYSDVIERPEIEMPEIAEQVVYPAKPATAPAAADASRAPSVTGYTPSETATTYKVNTADGVTAVSYTNISNWSYLYASVENYSSDYGNIKITLNNGTPAAERIAVQAVYYEGYDLGYAPVTVYLSELAEGEQYVIAELGAKNITNETYNEVQGETVRSKTVIGFVIFVDSLPSFAPTSPSGAFEITKFEFLKDGDPALEDRYVKPVVTMEGESATASGDGLLLPVEKYSADYTKYTVDLKGAAGSKVELAVQYKLGSTTAISAPKEVTLTGETQTAEYDFANTRPTAGGNDMTTQLIKNGTITAISVKPVDGSTATVSNPAFVRTATDKAYVADTWNSSASAVQIERAANGGNAKLVYEFYDTWFNFSVPVKKGSGVTGITLTLYAPDGIDHLGIGVTNNSMLSSNGQNAGTYILRGASYLFNGSETQKIGVQGTLDATEPNLEGLTETISYDEASKIYTITYDFSGIKKNNFAEYTMTSVIFYLNCPDTGNAQHDFDGTRTLYFLSIDLLTK